MGEGSTVTWILIAQLAVASPDMGSPDARAPDAKAVMMNKLAEMVNNNIARAAQRRAKKAEAKKRGRE
jgi:hypothetical protein